MLDNSTSLTQQIAEQSIKYGHLLASAESCTGGLIAKTLTDLAGSSKWFDCGFVTYSNAAKSSMLGVDPEVLGEYGAVSEPVVKAMCLGALENSQANLVVAVSGVAGPGGGSAEKPVGTVWVGWASSVNKISAHKYLFSGDRSSIRQQTLLVSLNKYLEMSKFPVQKD